jgi:CPA2 family monovalent cation:H+ antiporter-2
MHGAEAFLWNLALVLCVAAVTTVVFQKLKQPVVLGYLLAGVLVGPKLPIPLFADQEMIKTLSELGVILLMFSLGLEFSLAKLARVAKSGGMIALIEVSLMMSIGYAIGQALGFSPKESVFTGAIIAISSTTIIAKAFNEQRVEPRLGELVFGILVAEDLLAVLLVTVLTAIATGTGVSADMVVVTVGRLVAFLVGVLVIGILIIPRFVRFVVSIGRAETTVVASVGICFAIALLANKMGYSVALGAFLAGSLVAESGEAKHIEHLIQPVRDVFAAIFFVSVGMLLDPELMGRHWVAVLVLALTVVIGKVVGVTIGAFLSGASTRDSIQAGMSLAQIGEFSFIIAGVAAATSSGGEFLYPITVAVSALTTLLTPWLIRGSDGASAFVEKNLPHSVQTFASLYGAWITRLRETPHQPTFWTAFRRVVRLLLIDVAALCVLIIGTSLGLPGAVSFAADSVGLNPETARTVISGIAFLLGLPFAVGIARAARSLGSMIAYEALPQKVAERTGSETTALMPSPPRALVLTLQLAIVLVTGLPVLAVTGAFLPSIAGMALFGAILIAFVVIFVRSASHLEGQLRAATEMVVAMLAKQSRGEAGPIVAPEHAEAEARNAVEQVMPWFGALHSVELERASEAVGRTLAELGLRGRTGATVVAIRRGSKVFVPAADEALQAGDVLALTGSEQAIRLAKLVLAAPGGQLDAHTEMMISR